MKLRMIDWPTNLVQAVLVTIVLLTGVVHGTEPASDSSVRPSVALLEPEYVTHDYETRGRKLIAWLDMKLTESLSEREDCTMVSRQAMDELLEEKSLKNFNTETADEELKPFLSAGVLVCPTIVVENQKTNEAVLTIQAVVAQTGALLTEMVVDLQLGDEAVNTSPELEKSLQKFWKDMRETLYIHLKTPSFGVTGVELKSDLKRLQWMADDLRDLLSTQSYPGLVVLDGRQVLHTKEERLLTSMGLTESANNDGAAQLAPASDFQVSGELIEKVRNQVSFDQTPVELKLEVSRAGEQLAAEKWQGRVGSYSKIRTRAVAWARKELKEAANVSPQSLDESDARGLAREELQMVEKYSSMPFGKRRQLDPRIRKRVFRHAARAAHLDPTNEKAAYLAATSVYALYQGRDDLAGYARVMVECRRYLDRFGKKVPKHHHTVLRRLDFHGSVALAKLTMERPRRADPMRYKPSPKIYWFARRVVRVEARYGCMGMFKDKYNTGNTFEVFGFHLIHHLVPNCPDERLDEEYKWWRRFFHTTFQKAMQTDTAKALPPDHRPVPWELVDAAFSARKGDVDALRDALQRAARIIPEEDTRLWGGGKYSEAIIPVYLKKAGDSEWRTWRPKFTAEQSEQLTSEKLSEFVQSLNPDFPDVGGNGKSPRAPGRRFVIPEAVRKLGHKPGSNRPAAEVFLFVDGEAWISLPGPWVPARASRKESVLYRAPMPKTGSGRIELDPKRLKWPPYPGELPDGHSGKFKIQCHLVQPGKANTNVWLGTEKGLVRYEKQDGDWSGRWYTTRDGFPTNEIHAIIPVSLNGQRVLILLAPANENESQRFAFTLNPQSDHTRILFNGRQSELRISDHPAIKLEDGRHILCEMVPRDVYGKVDLGQMENFSDKGSWHHIASVTDPKTGEPSIWEGFWSGYRDRAYLRPISVKNARPGKQIFKARQFSVFVDDRVMSMFGNVHIYGKSEATLGTTPYFLTEYMIGVNDTLWIAAKPHRNLGMPTRLYGMRPSREGSKTWFGPFASPDGTPITNLAHARNGRMLLTTYQSTYLLDGPRLKAAAKKTGRIQSGSGTSAAFERRLKDAGWQTRVAAMIVTGEWKNGLKLLRQREDQIGESASSSRERVRVMLWRARLLADKPGEIKKSIDVYGKIARGDSGPSAAQAFAGVNQVYLLHRAKRYQQLVDVVKVLLEEYPQLKPKRSGMGLEWYLEHAKKKLKKQNAKSK